MAVPKESGVAMLVKSRVIIFAVTLLLGITAFTQIALAIDPSLKDLTIECGTGSTSAISEGSFNRPTASALSDGEVRVGKSIAYNNDPALNVLDGTITVTLSVWARTYADDASTSASPLVPMSGGTFVEVTDDIGDFAVLGTLPAGLVLDGTTIRWNLTDQASILGNAPLQTSYTLTVVNPPKTSPYELGHWYSTGTASARFVPAVGNPYYWETEETPQDEFTVDMSWNNGNGINSGTITDNFQGYTIHFPTNLSGEGQVPYNSDGTMNVDGQWNWWPQDSSTRGQAATANGSSYSWHLQWEKGSTHTNIFTIKDFGGPGADVQFRIELGNPGGNDSVSGGKTIFIKEHCQRSHSAGQGDSFGWSGDAITLKLDVAGQIRVLGDNIEPPSNSIPDPDPKPRPGHKHIHSRPQTDPKPDPKPDPELKSDPKPDPKPDPSPELPAVPGSRPPATPGGTSSDPAPALTPRTSTAGSVGNRDDAIVPAVYQGGRVVVSSSQVTSLPKTWDGSNIRFWQALLVAALLPVMMIFLAHRRGIVRR